MMGRIRSKNTLPEVRTRLAVHALGLRFRVHVADLPGKPDLANKTRRWAIFVHGCFWHSHASCRLASSPKSNTDYWTEKLARNKRRDADKIPALQALGFRVLVVWECEVRNDARLKEALAGFFRPTGRTFDSAAAAGVACNGGDGHDGLKPRGSNDIGTGMAGLVSCGDP
jgi:DNA mismatch endonuclease (patch repair protein)